MNDNLNEKSIQNALPRGGYQLSKKKLKYKTGTWKGWSKQTNLIDLNFGRDILALW